MKGRGIVTTGRYESPCGVLLLGSYGDRLCLCDWQRGSRRDSVDRRLKRLLRAEYEAGTSAVIGQAARQLDGFFAGRIREFDVPLLLVGTDFQRLVWAELRKIPTCATVTYGEIARRIGRPNAVRAVANAIGSNALSVFVPCHRVIGGDGSLTGYGGGLAAKCLLLELEGAL